MTASEKLTRTFKAASMEGEQYTIYLFTEYYDGSVLAGPSAMEPTGRFRLQTSDGKRVNHVERGKYVILGPFGEIPVTSDDPNAP